MKFLVFIGLTILIISCNSKNSGKQTIKEYYPNGNIKSTSEVENGIKNGITKIYRESGRLLSSAEYKNNLKNGSYSEYSDKNSKLMIEASFKDDIQDGKVLQYYQEGMLFRESFYKNGHLDSTIKTFWPDGKLKSENYYKMDTISTGLKEYDRNGNLMNKPHIVFEEINQLSLLNQVILQISLSDKDLKVAFYLDDLVEGKYLKPNSYKIAMKNGIGTINFQVARGHTLMKKISVIAKVQTKYGNALLLHSNYNLTVTNPR